MTDKRREEYSKPPETFTPEQVLALARAVPLIREAFVALDGLSRRDWFTVADDDVFCGPAGDSVEESAP